MSFSNNHDDQPLNINRAPAAITNYYGNKNNTPISDAMAKSVAQTLNRARTLGVAPATLLKIQGFDLGLKDNIKVLALMTQGPDLSQQLHMAPAQITVKGHSKP
jgi:uncharacterized protein YdaL